MVLLNPLPLVRLLPVFWLVNLIPCIGPALIFERLVTNPDSFPLPCMEHCVDQVGAAKYVSKFDLLKHYWQVTLSKRHHQLYSLTQSCHLGCKMPQALLDRLGLGPLDYQPVQM